MPELVDVDIEEVDDGVVLADILTDLGTITIIAHFYCDGSDPVVGDAHVETAIWRTLISGTTTRERSA